MNKVQYSLISLFFCLFLVGIDKIYAKKELSADNLLSFPILSWPPQGIKEKYPVTRDTWISSVSNEKEGSNGGASKLKLKGQQEYSIVDIESSPLKGKLVTGALLHVRSASPENASFGRVGISSIASPWVEGTAWWYWWQEGSSCFSQAEYKKRDWAYPGSTLMDVSFGHGNTIWKFAECTQPDKSGWQACAVDADVVSARVGGLSNGFVLYDEIGSTWSTKNGKFSYEYFPNRFCYSRESGGSEPWLEIWTNGADLIPPNPVKSIEVENLQLKAGEALVSWQTPKDFGGGKTLGFHVTYKKYGEKHEQQMPRYLIPMAGQVGEIVRMHIQNLPFKSGEKVVLTISPVDNAGNVGDPYTDIIKMSSLVELNIPEADAKPFRNKNDALTMDNIKVSIIDI